MARRQPGLMPVVRKNKPYKNKKLVDKAISDPEQILMAG